MVCPAASKGQSCKVIGQRDSLSFQDHVYSQAVGYKQDKLTSDI